MKQFKWTKMNYRHSGWGNGYRYFVTWGRLGLWSSGLGDLNTWLKEQYGPARISIQGPPTQEQIDRLGFMSWGLGRYPNPAWDIDVNKRRIYLTEETLMWARLLGKID